MNNIQLLSFHESLYQPTLPRLLTSLTFTALTAMFFLIGNQFEATAQSDNDNLMM